MRNSQIFLFLAHLCIILSFFAWTNVILYSGLFLLSIMYLFFWNITSKQEFIFRMQRLRQREILSKEAEIAFIEAPIAINNENKKYRKDYRIKARIKNRKYRRQYRNKARKKRQ